MGRTLLETLPVEEDLSVQGAFLLVALQNLTVDPTVMGGWYSEQGEI